MGAGDGDRLGSVEWSRAAALAALASALLSTGLFWGLPTAKAVVGALRVLEGGVPYRDFWTMYAPGQFYAVALLFRLFGAELWIQALATALVNGVAVGAFFLLLRRIGAPLRIAAPLALLVAATMWSPSPELRDYPLVRPLLLGAWTLLCAYFLHGGARPLAAAGATLGCAAWFKHDAAGFVAASAALSIALAWGLAGARRPGAWLHPVRAIAILAGASLAAAAPVALALAVCAGADAWQDLVVFPATLFPTVRTDPFPGPIPDLTSLRDWLARPGDLRLGRAAGWEASAWLLGWLPVLVFAAGAATLAVARRRIDPARQAVALLFLVGLLPFWAASHVQQNTHPQTLALQSLALGALAWTGVGRSGRSALARTALVALAGVQLLALAIEPATEAWWMQSQWAASRPLDLPGTRFVRVGPKEHAVYSGVARFVRENVPPGEPIYVGVARHGAIVIPDLRVLWVSARRSATRHAELHPGVTDRARVQREIIGEIERAGVRCVVLWHFGWPRERLDRIQAQLAAATPDGGAALLDAWLREHFVGVARYGELEVLWRRDAPPP